MSIEKFEPRLRHHLDEARLRASRQGRDVTEVDRSLFEVTISHPERIAAPRGVRRADRRAALAELGERVRTSQRPVIERIRELTGQEPAVVHSLVNAVTARLTPAQIEALSEMDEVQTIRLERLDQVTCMNETVHVIEATEAWNELGASGDDVTVALLDSGADKTHPALAGKIVDEVSTASEPVTIPGFHGTHTAGTIVSNDPVFRGVAFGADLINIKVLTAANFGQPAWVIQGLTEALIRGAQVGSMSLGWSEIFHGWICDDANCILCQAADNAVSLGLALVVAAGNEGGMGARPPFAIRHPGAARSVVTVGAVDKAKTLWGLSSTGPGSGRLSPGSAIRVTKPEVTAPGVNVVSSVLGGGFMALSGTSMATPHVAGVAALTLEQEPDLTPMQVKKILEESCEPLTNGPNATAYGLISAYGCVFRVSD